MKEVKNQPGQNPKEVKKISLLDIVSFLKRGKNPAQIAKELGISKQRLNYYLADAKSQGLVKKIGYGVWEVDVMKEVKISTKDTILQPGQVQKPKEVRGHAFIWKVRVPKSLKNIDWKAKLQEKGIEFKEVGLKQTPRLLIENRKVWFGKENIIIYELESFFAVNSIESRKLAVYKLLDLLKKIENKVGINLSPYEFTPRREHYALIKNNLAIQCNREGTKIQVFNKKGLWFLIDNSYNLDEAETVGADGEALVDNIGVQRYFNEHKETKFNVTPKFILNSFAQQSQVVNGMLQNANLYNANIVSHVKAIQQLGEGVEKNNRIMEKIAALLEAQNGIN